MGVKERRTKILLILFLLSETGVNFLTVDENVQKIADLSMNQKTKATLSSLVKEGLIEADKEATDQKRYRLTDLGFTRLSLTFPYVRFLRETWDKKWRILSYEIPEKKRDLRDKLRREVAGWGLGPWHRSFWLTPHPVIANLKQLVSGKEEEGYVQAFESEHVFGDQEILIEKVWGKSQLEAKYRQLFKSWHLILSQNDEKILKLKKVVTEYINLLKQDPGLPADLVGTNWIGFEAFTIYKEIRSILLS